MPLFRPFPSRRWLKESLANAQHKLASTQRSLDALQGRYLGEVADLSRRNALLEAQVSTQAQTIADLDADDVELRAQKEAIQTALIAERQARSLAVDQITRVTQSKGKVEEALAVTQQELGDALEALERAHEELSDSAALLHVVRKGEKLHPIVERLVLTLWASRRRWQERAEYRGGRIERNGQAAIIEFVGGDRVEVLGDRADWSRR